MIDDAPNSNHEAEIATDASLGQPPPIPPRFWWLKRLALGGVCLLLAVVGLRLWWGYEADRRLQRQIDQYRSAGELVTAADFDRMLDAVPEDENAAVLLEVAIVRMWEISVSGVTLVQTVSDLGKLDEETNVATDLYVALQPVLDLVRQARSRPAVAWSQRVAVDLAKFNALPMSGGRHLGKLLYFAATCQFRLGDHAAAVETLHDALFFSEALEAHPTLLASLVAWSIHNLSFSRIERFGAQIDICDHQERADGPNTCATRARVHNLIDVLLDDSKSGAALTRAFYGERAHDIGFIYFADSLARQGGLIGRSTRAVTRPLDVLRTVRAAKLRTRTAEAAAHADWPGALAAAPGD